MVEEFHVEGLERQVQLPRGLQVGFAGERRAGGMVVYEDDGLRLLVQRPAQDLFAVDERAIGRPGGEFLLPGDHVGAVQEHCPALLMVQDLDVYLGEYVSAELGLDIIVTKEGNTLLAQIGDDAFSFEAVDKDKFKYDPIGATFEFDPEKNTMTLFQYGEEVVFQKRK